MTIGDANYSIEHELGKLEKNYSSIGYKFKPDSMNRKSISDSKQLVNKNLGYKVVSHLTHLGNHVIGDLVLPKKLKMDVLNTYSHSLVAASPASIITKEST